MNWRHQNIRLRRLEAEAIYIMREVVSEFRNPVMLYSMGKDSSALLHVAQKAFHPGKVPFPLLHVDTTWKFREMIAFRDETAAPCGHGHARIRQRGGHCSGHFTGILGFGDPHPGDEDRRPAPGAGQVALRRRFRRGAARRGKKPRQGAHFLAPLRQPRLGPAQSAARTVAAVQYADKDRQIHAGISVVQLDRTRCLGIHQGGEYSGRAAVLRQAASGRGARRHADHGRR